MLAKNVLIFRLDRVSLLTMLAKNVLTSPFEHLLMCLKTDGWVGNSADPDHTVKHFNLATANFGGSIFWRIFDFRKKKIKSIISDVALYFLCMQILHGDLQVKHNDFQLFSTLHYSCV